MAFVHLTPSNEPAFFEITATLIPILLFGGVLVERAKPPAEEKWRLWHDVAAPYLPLFGAFAIFGEALAIRSAVAGDASTFARVYVSLVLVLSMTLIVTAISIPWFAGLKKSDRKFYKRVGPAVLGAVVLSAIGASALLITGTNVAAEKEEVAAVGKAVSHSIAEQEAVRRQIQPLVVQIEHLGQLQHAAAVRGDFAAYKSLGHEIDGLYRLVLLDFKHEKELMLEAANLLREEVGARALKQLPHKNHRQPPRSSSANDAPR